MDFTNLLIAIAIGAVIALIAAIIRAAIRPKSSRFDRLVSKGAITSQGMAPGTGGAEMVMLSRDELEDALRKYSDSSMLMNWVQSFLWFSVGTGVSLFSNEIRSVFFG